MPFLGQDWRSPGEQWVRTGEGWHRLDLWRLKLLENVFENVVGRHQLKLADGELGYVLMHKELKPSQPYVLIKEVTKEQKMRASVSEALGRLDVSGAVWDHKRLNYVSKLMLHLIQHKMSSLSGTAQKSVINILSQIVQQAVKTRHDPRIVRQLLNETRAALTNGRFDHVGSSVLWESHSIQVEKLQRDLDESAIGERDDDDDDDQATLADLPDDVVRHILSRLSDHRDVVNAGRTESRTFELSEENVIWRKLGAFHFGHRREWQCVVRKEEENVESVGWKTIYTRLVKRFGLRDVYADMLHFCRHCNALFWELHGHPCVVSNVDPESSPVSPKEFLELFST